MTKTVTVFAASGIAGQACVNGLLEHPDFDVRILRRKPGQEEKSTSGLTLAIDEKQKVWDDWTQRGAEIREADVTRHAVVGQLERNPLAGVQGHTDGRGFPQHHRTGREDDGEHLSR